MGLDLVKPATLAPCEAVQASPPHPGASKASLQEAARQFEGLLMSMLFQNMRKTIQPSGLFGEEGQARKTYDYLLDQAVVEHALKSGKGWGLAERLEKAWAAQPGAGSIKNQHGA